MLLCSLHLRLFTRFTQFYPSLPVAFYYLPLQFTHVYTVGLFILRSVYTLPFTFVRSFAVYLYLFSSCTRLHTLPSFTVLLQFYLAFTFTFYTTHTVYIHSLLLFAVYLHLQFPVALPLPLRLYFTFTLHFTRYLQLHLHFTVVCLYFARFAFAFWLPLPFYFILRLVVIWFPVWLVAFAQFTLRSTRTPFAFTFAFTPRFAVYILPFARLPRSVYVPHTHARVTFCYVYLPSLFTQLPVLRYLCILLYRFTVYVTLQLLFICLFVVVYVRLRCCLLPCLRCLYLLHLFYSLHVWLLLPLPCLAVDFTTFVYLYSSFYLLLVTYLYYVVAVVVDLFGYVYLCCCCWLFPVYWLLIPHVLPLLLVVTVSYLLRFCYLHLFVYVVVVGFFLRFSCPTFTFTVWLFILFYVYLPLRLLRFVTTYLPHVYVVVVSLRFIFTIAVYLLLFVYGFV